MVRSLNGGWRPKRWLESLNGGWRPKRWLESTELTGMPYSWQEKIAKLPGRWWEGESGTLNRHLQHLFSYMGIAP